MVNILLGIHSLAPVGVVSRGGIVIDRLLDLSSLKLAENCGQHPLELRQVLVVQHWLYDDLKQVNIPNVKSGKSMCGSRMGSIHEIWIGDTDTRYRFCI